MLSVDSFICDAPSTYRILVVQRLTAVTAHLKSKQLLLFAFAGQSGRIWGTSNILRCHHSASSLRTRDAGLTFVHFLRRLSNIGSTCLFLLIPAMWTAEVQVCDGLNHYKWASSHIYTEHRSTRTYVNSYPCQLVSMSTRTHVNSYHHQMSNRTTSDVNSFHK